MIVIWHWILPACSRGQTSQSLFFFFCRYLLEQERTKEYERIGRIHVDKVIFFFSRFSFQFFVKVRERSWEHPYNTCRCCHEQGWRCPRGSLKKIKNPWLCHHKRGWKVSQGLLISIQRCHASERWYAAIPRQKIPSGCSLTNLETVPNYSHCLGNNLHHNDPWTWKLYTCDTNVIWQGL